MIYYQILSTHSLRKYIEISWENLWILELKGLSVISSISAGRYPENATFMHVWVLTTKQAINYNKEMNDKEKKLTKIMVLNL